MATSGTIYYMPIPSNINFGLVIDWKVTYVPISPYVSGGYAYLSLDVYLRTNDTAHSSYFTRSTSMTDKSATLDWTTIPNANTKNRVYSSYTEYYLETCSNGYLLSLKPGSSTVYASINVDYSVVVGTGGYKVNYMGTMYELPKSGTIEIPELDATPINNLTISTSGITQTSATITASSNGGEMLTYYQYSLDNGSTWTYFQSDPSISAATAMVTLTGLNADTAYSIKARALSSMVQRTSSATSFRTQAYSTPSIILISSGHTTNTFSISAQANMTCNNWTYYLNGTAYPFTYSQNSTSASQTITDLVPGNSYSIYVKANGVPGGLVGTSNTLTFSTNSKTEFTTTTYNMALSADSSFSIVVDTKNNTNKSTLAFKYTDNDQTISKEIFSGRALTDGSNTVTISQENISWLTGVLGDLTEKTFTLSLTTYDSNDIWLGVDETATLRVYIAAEDAPVFSNFTYQDTNTKTVALTGNNQHLINGYSTILIDASSAHAVSPATIVSYSASYGDTTVSGSSSSIYISKFYSDNAGSKPLTVTVTDSYGRSTAVTKNVTSSLYDKISLSPLTVIRDEDGDIFATISGSYHSVIIGNTEKNSLQEFYYEYRASNEVEWHSGTSISPTVSDTDFSIVSSQIDDLDPELSWYIRFVAKDKLTEDISQAILTTNVPLMSFRKDGVGIKNKNPESALDVLGEIRMNGFNVEGFVRVVSGEDLNDILDTGIYVAEADPDYSSDHYPSNVRGIMEILPESQGIVQRFTKVPADGTMWIRHYNDSTNPPAFGQWYQIAGEGTFTQVQSDWDETDTTSKAFILHKPIIPPGVTVDDAMSSSSTNPVENRVITAALDAVGTTSATIASGDAIIFSDTSDGGKLKKSDAGFTTSTSTYLRRNGTWGTPTNTIPSAQCETAAGTAAKAGDCTNYSLKANSYVHVNVRYSNTSAGALTLDINSKGAKPIYINGEASSSTNYTLPAGTYIAYYDGTAYQFRTDGVLPGKILAANTADQVPWSGIQNRPTVSHVTVELDNTDYAIVLEDI